MWCFLVKFQIHNLFSKTYFSGENLLLESNSPLVLELLRIFRASLTFLGTEVGGWGGADVGKLAGPVKKGANSIKIYVLKVLEIGLVSLLQPNFLVCQKLSDKSSNHIILLRVEIKGRRRQQKLFFQILQKNCQISPF